jgi:conjugative relaxase-like TrwC/TraI family protein
MLSVAVARNTRYYTEALTEEAFLGVEERSAWHGEGAARLGLACGSPVQPDVFERLFAGFSPEGETPLVQNAGRANRQSAWDLTFSAPKSFSVLTLLSPEPLARQLRACHREAVKETLDHLEAEHLQTRRGKGGYQRESARLVAALFSHDTSRAADPQIHTHAVILNLGVRKDGTTGSIRSRPFYDQKMLLGQRYRNGLAQRLSQRLGLSLSWNADHTLFEIEAIPPAVCAYFSQRRQQIEETLDRQERAGTAAEAAIAARDTRTAKKCFSAESLRQHWQQAAERLGFGAEQIAALLDTLWRGGTTTTVVFSAAGAHGTGPSREPDATPQTPLEPDLKRWQALAQEGSFDRRDIERVFRRAWEEAWKKWASPTAEAQRLLQEGWLPDGTSLIPLGRLNGWTRYSSAMTLLTEEMVCLHAEKLAGQRTYPVSWDTVREALESAVVRALWERLTRLVTGSDAPASPLLLTEDQRHTLRHLTSGSGDLAFLDAGNGTGRSVTLAVARIAWEKAGYQVQGVALSASGASALQEQTGIASAPMASFRAMAEHLRRLHSGDPLERWLQAGRYLIGRGIWPLARHTVLVVDGAEQLSDRDTLTLLQLARRAQAKLVITGDLRGSSLTSLLASQFGRARLTEPLGPQPDHSDPDPGWRQQMARAALENRILPALEALDERGYILQAKTRADAHKLLIKSWWQQAGRNPEKHLILAPNATEAEQLNRAAQQARQRHGLLGRRKVRLTGVPVWGWLREAPWLYERDRIEFRRTNRGIGVRHGDRGTIRRINYFSRTLTVNLDKGKVVRVPLRQYRDIDLAYAFSVARGAQLRASEHAFILAGGAGQGLEATRVQLTRASRNTYLFTDRNWNEVVYEMGRTDVRPSAVETAVRARNEARREQAIRAKEKDTTSRAEKPREPEWSPTHDLVPHW